jgi:hypothetical protein
VKIHCEETADPEVIGRVRSRYENELSTLDRLRFDPLCVYNESLFPFSAVVWFVPLFLMLFYREVLQIRSPLRVSTNHPLLIERAHATYGLVMGLGVKFYTGFTDGTILISANFPSRQIDDRERRIYKYAASASIHVAWQAHQERIAELQDKGKVLDQTLHFGTYVRISTSAESS